MTTFANEEYFAIVGYVKAQISVAVINLTEVGHNNWVLAVQLHWFNKSGIWIMGNPFLGVLEGQATCFEEFIKISSSQ